MITIHGDEIRKLCISDMHFTYKDFIDPNSQMSALYKGFVDYATQSDADLIVNYGDTISSEYLWYLHSLSSNSLAPNVSEQSRKEYAEQLTRRRLRHDSVKPDSFHSISHLIQQFARASGYQTPLTLTEIEHKLNEIRTHDSDVMRHIITQQNSSAKPFYILHGNHECITLSESEVAGIFNRASGHKGVTRTSHQYSFYKDFELINAGRDPIYAREIFFNANVHNHAKGGLVFAPYDIEWLQDTLAATKGHAVINMHIPISFDQTPEQDPYSITRSYKESAALRNILGQAGNVALVNMGHIHRIMYDQIQGVNYLTMPSFRHIPSFVADEGRKGLKDPTGYFHEVSLNFGNMNAQVERKRVLLNKDNKTSIKSERKERPNFAPQSPFSFDL
jgi:UDP-2,3-diacylglucosamine pyrophosphatase LpxH|tara:strand:- start:348974 stop:350146 length:1173 start_codon:yes stop_codon:yes gene_type:complete